MPQNEHFEEEARLLVEHCSQLQVVNESITNTSREGVDMAGGITALDEAIREYLFFRGFVNTLKQFETERKEDRDKELNVRR